MVYFYTFISAVYILFQLYFNYRNQFLIVFVLVNNNHTHFPLKVNGECWQCCDFRFSYNLIHTVCTPQYRQKTQTHITSVLLLISDLCMQILHIETWNRHQHSHYFTLLSFCIWAHPNNHKQQNCAKAHTANRSLTHTPSWKMGSSCQPQSCFGEVWGVCAVLFPCCTHCSLEVIRGHLPYYHSF